MNRSTILGVPRQFSLSRARTPATRTKGWTPHRLAVVRALPVMELSAPVLALAGGGAAALGVLALKSYGYSQLAYIRAAMLSRWLPKGGKEILIIGGDTKDLFYLPSDCNTATLVLEGGADEKYWREAASQASIPLRIRERPGYDLKCFPDNSFDAAAVLLPLTRVPDRQATMLEIARIVKPGSKVVIIQRLQGGGIQGVMGDTGTAISEDELFKTVNIPGLEEFQWDVALDSLDPHAVGVCSKSSSASGKKASFGDEKTKVEKELMSRPKKTNKKDKGGFK